MRNQVTRFLTGFLCLAGLLLLSQPALADPVASEGGSSTVHNLISGWSNTLYNILKFVLGGGAIISIGMASYHIIEGKNDSAKKFISTIVICAISFTVLEVLQNVLPHPEGGTLTKNVASVLTSLLSMISLISFVGIMLKLLSGQEQEIPMKLYTWLIASTVGIALLTIIGNNATF